MKTIADRIAAVQKQFNLNDPKLAKMCGVTKQAVGKWKNVGARPEIDALINMRESLGVSDVWVLEGKGPMLIPTDSDPFIQKMREIAPDLSPEAKTKILGFAEVEADSAQKQ